MRVNANATKKERRKSNCREARKFLNDDEGRISWVHDDVLIDLGGMAGVWDMVPVAMADTSPTLTAPSIFPVRSKPVRTEPPSTSKP
ncbi:hypothetical protein ACLB2K_071313 [Fragaria x ananassa]